MRGFAAEAAMFDESAADSIGHEPRLAPRDELIFLLHTAAEIEHALMVQYLFAWFSLRTGDQTLTDDQRTLVGNWASAIFQVAKEEMGHLITVQNLLRSIGGPLNLEREDMPFRSMLYPFPFQLEPLSKHSLAKYVFAEMPAESEMDPQYAEVVAEARRNVPSDDQLNHVGVLFARILELIDEVPTEVFHNERPGFQAAFDDWAGGDSAVIVETIRSKSDAKRAVEEIAEQGEGMTSPAPDSLQDSHFETFFGIYNEFPGDGSWSPVYPIPDNVNTLQLESDDVEPDLIDEVLRQGSITHAKSRLFAQLFNQRYRMLLLSLMHTLSIEADNVDGTESGRGDVRGWVFNEMYGLTAIANLLVKSPLTTAGDGNVAAAPFELPYTLAIPDQKRDRWRMHIDLFDSSNLLTDKLGAMGLSENEQEIVDDVKDRDEQSRARVYEICPDISPELKVASLRIFPPIAIARVGSAEEPLDNFELVAAGTGYREIRPTETLIVDRVSGEIRESRIPNQIRFKDDNKVRPVAPFLEVWIQTMEGGDYQPLTDAMIRDLGAEGSWRVRVANLKAWRRTGDVGDRVTYDTGEFTHFRPIELPGDAPNFKVGKTISFGSVQAIKPTEDFPEVRLRFTPAAGKVFGSDNGDPNIADDVYDSGQGGWKGFPEDGIDYPVTTLPGGIHANSENGSLGYLDDTCDGIVEFTLVVGDQTHTAQARVSSGPPDYAPDSLPVRNLTDDLEQMLLGMQIGSENSIVAVRELVRRALEAIRLMNTTRMNDRGMAAHDTGTGRALEPIFRPTTRAAYSTVLGFHQRALETLEEVSSSSEPATRNRARGFLERFQQILRRYDQVGDLTDAGRQKMPAMMRGSDGRHLAVTRRLIAHVERALGQLSGGPTVTPEQAMLDLIASKMFGQIQHSAIPVGGGTLADLFDTPSMLLQYLRTAKVTGNQIPEVNDRPLITPQSLSESAFLTLVTDPRHPMQSRFSSDDVAVIEAWIMSLPFPGPIA